ncbi:hypothetical protein AMAG_00123, partial [Allomyces macrogynus ATCC 38327]
MSTAALFDAQSTQILISAWAMPPSQLWETRALDFFERPRREKSAQAGKSGNITGCCIRHASGLIELSALLIQPGDRARAGCKSHSSIDAQRLTDSTRTATLLAFEASMPDPTMTAQPAAPGTKSPHSRPCKIEAIGLPFHGQWGSARLQAAAVWIFGFLLLLTSSCSAKGTSHDHHLASPALHFAPEPRDLVSSAAGCRVCHRPSEVQIGMVTHGNWDVGTFWSSAKRGFTTAATLYNISVSPFFPTVFDVSAIGATMASTERNFRLVGTTVVDASLASTVQTGIANGTTVVSFNSGDSFTGQTGVMYHVGQPEYTAGFKVGTALGRGGKSRVLCVISEAGNSGLVSRCQGVVDGIRSISTSPHVTVTNLDGFSSTAFDAGLNTTLNSNPSFDAIVTLGSDQAIRAVNVVQSRGQGASIGIATFDISTDVLAAIRIGQILLAVDQQEFLQTFATVQFLKLYHMTGGMRLKTQLLLSGPSIITAVNVHRKQCQVDPSQVGCTSIAPSSITIGLVATGMWSSNDAFQQQAKYGALAAAREHGTTLRFIDTSVFDLQALSSQVATVINQGISALVLPVPSTASGQDFTALIDMAAAANVSVITWGTGMARGADRVQLGKAAMHIGQNETLSGMQVGARLNALIPSGAQALCVTQELGSDDMPLKCAGIQAALTNGRAVAPAGIASSLVLAISSRNTPQSIATIQAALAAFPQIAAMVYPTPEAARMVLSAIPTGRAMVVAGYGLNQDVAAAIGQGHIAFTVNEQPFLQGYLAVAGLSFFLTHGYILQNSVLETGPFFVDTTNVATFACLANTARDPSAECWPCPSKCTINGECLDSGECACKSGWLLGPELDCQVKDPGLQFIVPGSGMAIAFQFLASLGIATALGLAVFIFVFRAHPIIKATSWAMCIGMQAGIVLLFASIFLGVGIPTASVCIAQMFVPAVAFATVIGLLLAKTMRVWKLFHTINLIGAKVTDAQVVSWAAGIVAVNVVICAAWVASDPPQPELIAGRAGVTNVVCSSQSGSAFLGVLLSYNVLLILAGAVLGFITRTVEARQFNESKPIGMVMYNLTVLAAIGLSFLLTAGTNTTLAYPIQSMLVFLGCMSTNGILFGPKIFAIVNLKRTSDSDNTDVKFCSFSAATRKPSRHRGIWRGGSATALAPAKTTVETMVMRTRVRVITSRLDKVLAPWYAGILVVFHDGKAPVLGVLDADRPTNLGVFMDLGQATVKVLGGAVSGPVESAPHESSNLPGSSHDNVAATSVTEMFKIAGIVKLWALSGHQILIQMPTTVALNTWSTYLTKACGGSRPSSGPGSRTGGGGGGSSNGVTAGGGVGGGGIKSGAVETVLQVKSAVRTEGGGASPRHGRSASDIGSEFP